MDPAETPAFHGQSFIELKKMKTSNKFGMEIEFKSLLSDGILLYAQEKKDNDADYISLTLVAGYHYSFKHLFKPSAILIMIISLILLHSVVPILLMA